MAKIITDNKHYADIAERIRQKTNTNNQYYPSELAAGVNQVFQTGLETLLELSDTTAVNELMNHTKHGVIFKWAGVTSNETINGETVELVNNSYYAIKFESEWAVPILQRVYLGTNSGIESYYSYQDAQQALANQPLDGTLCFYIGNTEEVGGEYEELFTTSDGYDIYCKVNVFPYTILISSHTEETDEYGNITYHYEWQYFMSIPQYGIHIESVDTLPSFNEAMSDVVYETMNGGETEYYVLGIRTTSQSDESYWIRGQLIQNILGCDFFQPIIEHNGSTELWFAGDYEINVPEISGYETIIAHTPYIAAQNITNLSEVTDDGVLYTMPDGTQYTKGYLEEGGTVAVPAQWSIDNNGFDTVQPLLKSDKVIVENGDFDVSGDAFITVKIDRGTTPEGTLEIYPSGGRFDPIEHDVTNIATVIEYPAYNYYEYVSVNTLEDIESIVENTIYTLPDGKQYIAAMSAASGTDEPTGQYYLVPCYLTADQYGSDAPMAMIDPTAIVPTDVLEYSIIGDATFDVTTAATFIAHTPQILYVDITDLSQVTDGNTLYTMPDGNNYMFAIDGNGTTKAIRAEVWTDINGFDCLVPVIDEHVTQEAIDNFVEEQIVGGEW